MSQEIDDMYFTSKDRVKKDQFKREENVSHGTTVPLNTSDSYSARNENPDYVAGSKVGSNSRPAYFNSNYQPVVNQNLYAYNNSYTYSYTYYNPYAFRYNMMFVYGYPYNFYSYGYPYYGYGYNGYGYNSYYSYPYNYGYYPYNYGYGYYSYPTLVTHVDHHVVYGRRPSRSSSNTTPSYYGGRPTRGNSAYYVGNNHNGTRTSYQNNVYRNTNTVH